MTCGSSGYLNRREALVAAKAAGDRLLRLAGSIAALRRRLPARTTVAVGLPLPDEFFSTHLDLESDDADSLVVQLALFVHHLPALSEFIATHRVVDNAATGVFLKLLDDGSLLVSWHERGTLQFQEHTLKLRM